LPGVNGGADEPTFLFSMKIVFYCAEHAPANIDNYLHIGASGTVSALILASHGLSRLGHEVVVLNRSESGIFQQTRHLRTDSPEQVPDRLEELGEVDIFVANGFASGIFLTHPIKARKRAAWVHNFIDQNPIERAIAQGRLDYVVCISHNQLGTWWRSPVFGRVAQIYNCIDTGAMDEVSIPAAKERKIMFIGAPRQSKGFHDALRIFDAFSKQNPGYTFYVAGAASLHGSSTALSENGVFEKAYEESHLKDLLRTKEGTPREDVVLLGTISREEVLRHLGTTMVALQNPCWDSEPEVHSVSALEAQAMGVPVLTAFRGGQPEVVIDGHTGILMKTPDIGSAVRALGALVGDPQLAHRMSESAKRHIRERFKVEAIACDWDRNLAVMSRGDRFKGNLMKAIRIKCRHKLRR
jgi:glycosyltransferase involved in cell wall biosynthesis